MKSEQLASSLHAMEAKSCVLAMDPWDGDLGMTGSACDTQITLNGSDEDIRSPHKLRAGRARRSEAVPSRRRAPVK
jgi:hypothetical protein